MKIILLLLTTFFSLNTLGQTKQNSNEDPHEHHQHEHHKHEHHKNEIGIANAPVFFIKENILAYGFHFHYVRNIPKSKFGLGFGYERIFDEHKHNTFGIVGAYRPIQYLNINISPGLAFEDESKQPIFALHLECSYEFEIKDFHIGPVIEAAYDQEDYHLSIGLHIGYGF